MTLGLINANPVVHAKKERVARTDDFQPAASTSAAPAVDPLDVYDILLLNFPFTSLILTIFYKKKI